MYVFEFLMSPCRIDIKGFQGTAESVFFMNFVVFCELSPTSDFPAKSVLKVGLLKNNSKVVIVAMLMDTNRNEMD